MKLDPLDLIILKELTVDGRASLREIARRASLSTPTVSARFERMKHAGLIQKFIPVLDLDASENSGIIALVSVRAPTSKIDLIAKALSQMPEVHGVFMTASPNNLILKVSLPNTQSLQNFVMGSELRKLKVEVGDSQIITKTVKDEHPLPLAGQFQMRLKCDLCKGEISSSKPYSIKVASTRYYFCCKTCKSTYLDKHALRIRALNKQVRSVEA
jgi:Lrp/AsnC family leucine-responsive transcriptional regulator